MARILKIDLGKREHFVVDRPELTAQYLGGTGVASKLLIEECPQGADPMSPENPIILATGPMTGMFPVVTKVVACFKSPLTNEYGESHAGGRLGTAMRWAGLDAIVVKGKANRPAYIAIHDEEVKVKNAETLWGMSSIRTVGRILREAEPGAGRRSILRIGRAGENLVKYACVNVDTVRHFGRLGLGAVFGSKNLKAMVIEGTQDIFFNDIKKYKAAYDDAYGVVCKTKEMTKYHDLGTPSNVLSLNAMGALPTRNFTSGAIECADNISGEYFAEHYLARKTACTGCPVGCIHIGWLREQFASDHEYFTVYTPYDYELIYAFGSNLGISDPHEVLKLIERAEIYGLDAITTGVYLAWLTEALAKGTLTTNETGGLEVKFGNSDGYCDAIKRIAERDGELYDSLADSLDSTTKKYGGAEFVVEAAGHPIAGYTTGIANILGHTLGARHSHLDNAGYSTDQKLAGKKFTVEEVVDALIAEEQFRQVLTSLVACLFARKIYTEDRIIACLDSIGITKTKDDLVTIGKAIMANKLAFKKREGFDLSNAKVTQRLIEAPTPQGKISQDDVNKGIAYYLQKMGAIEQTAK